MRSPLRLGTAVSARFGAGFTETIRCGELKIVGFVASRCMLVPGVPRCRSSGRPRLFYFSSRSLRATRPSELVIPRPLPRRPGAILSTSCRWRRWRQLLTREQSCWIRSKALGPAALPPSEGHVRGYLARHILPLTCNLGGEPTATQYFGFAGDSIRIQRY